MKILVTGGGGFLGTYICQLLVARGYEVWNFSRNSYSHLKNLGVETITGDLRDALDVDHAVSQNFDAVFHVAAKAGVWGREQDYYEINTVGTRNIVRSMIKHNTKTLIYTSTPSVAVDNRDICGEDESTPYPTSYLNAYGKTKMLAEKFVIEHSDKIHSISIRPHLIWGPGDPHIFPRLVQASKQGRLKKVGDGNNLVDVIYVENAAKAHLQAFDALRENPKLSGNTYFIGQNEPVNLWDFINQVLVLSKCEPVQNSISFKMAYKLGWLFEKVYSLLGIYSPDPPMTRYVAVNMGKSHYFSHQKARDDFGYEATISVEEGLKKTFDVKS